MKKTISLFPALLMCAALLPFTLGAAHADAEGQLSDSVYWSFDAANGKLTIGGTGEIPGFIYGQVRPWGDYADAIREIEILDGVTAIGTYAFQSHGSLKKVPFQTASHGSTIVPFIIAERCRRSRFRTL